MAQENKSTVGNPIWVESLMTEKEYNWHSAKYSTYRGNFPPSEFDCDFKWRKGMGANLTPEEINLINSRIDAILKKADINR